MKKEYRETIIEDIKAMISNRKYYNAEYKELKKKHNKEAAEHKKQYGNMWANAWLEEQQNKEIVQLLDSYHNDQSYHIIYKDGSERCFDVEDILTGEAKGISYNNIAYIRMISADDEIDSERGNLTWDISEDSERDEREEYLDRIEIKYGTTWGKKHA